MCRGFQQIEERERLKIKAFYVHLSFSKSLNKALHDYLTLHFLPRINGSSLEIDGLTLRPDTPGFITLHRVVTTTRVYDYGSRERVRISEGSRFEIYASDVKLLKGTFRKYEKTKWKLDCTCQLEGDDRNHALAVDEAEVCVEVEGQVGLMSEKVEMVTRRKRGRRFQGLEEIPEEREVDEREFEWDDGRCCCCCSDCDGKAAVEMGGQADRMLLDGVSSWAVDVGIWMMCLGVGYLVASKASCMKIIGRQRRLF